MPVTITAADVRVFIPNIDDDKATALITGALARAAQVAPCILTDDFPHVDAAKGIIVEAIVRRAEAGGGVLSMQQAGPFQQAMDTRTSPRVLFWPTEIVELERLCAVAQAAGTDALPHWKFGDPVVLTSPLAERLSPHTGRTL